MLWLSGELVKSSSPGVEGLCQALLRQISGGDNSPSNVWLAENVLGLLNSNRYKIHSLAVISGLNECKRFV